MPNYSLDNGNDNGNGAGSWGMYQRLVLSEIKQNKLDIAENTKNINQIRIDLAVLQVKAAGAGIVAGLIAAGLVEWIISSLK